MPVAGLIVEGGAVLEGLLDVREGDAADELVGSSFDGLRTSGGNRRPFDRLRTSGGRGRSWYESLTTSG